MAPPDWIEERDVFAAGSHDSPGELMGLGRFQGRLAEPKLRSFFGLDEACKRWDQQASEAMDKGLEDLASTTRPLDATLPYIEDNLDELLKSLAGEHVELSSLSDDSAELVRTAITLEGPLEQENTVITTGDLSEARRAIGAAKEVGQRLLEDLAGGSH